MGAPPFRTFWEKLGRRQHFDAVYPHFPPPFILSIRINFLNCKDFFPTGNRQNAPFSLDFGEKIEK